VARLVLFSTDKAVRPRSVLGQTKAVAEWVVAAAGRASGGRYTSVRLANVLDSAGSIVPMFRSQVAAGRSVTVTHPDATRYLITDAEAAGLAVVAGALGDPGAVYWLDAGDPVSVLDLARRVAAGAGGDFAVDYVGLRPGENLHERLFDPDDEPTPTGCEGVWSSPLPAVDPGWLESRLDVLAGHVGSASPAGVRAVLAELVESPVGAELRPAAAL
jgi:FlaA1/EpsC-like NDP-sugar epimerase